MLTTPAVASEPTGRKNLHEKPRASLRTRCTKCDLLACEETPLSSQKEKAGGDVPTSQLRSLTWSHDTHFGSEN